MRRPDRFVRWVAGLRGTRARRAGALVLEGVTHAVALWVVVTWVWQFLPTFSTKISGTLPVTVDSRPALAWQSQIRITLGGGTVSVPGRFWGPMRLELTVGTITQDQARALGDLNDLGRLVDPLVWLALARLGEVVGVACVLYLGVFAAFRRALRRGIVRREGILRGEGIVRPEGVTRGRPIGTDARPPWGPAVVAAALSVTLTIVGAVTGVLDVDTRSSIDAAAQVAGGPGRSSPAGAAVRGVEIATVGDSRVGYWSAGPLAGTDALDYACTRTSDSLAAQLALINSSSTAGQGVRAANVACTGATIADFGSPQEVVRRLPSGGNPYHVPISEDGRYGTFTVPSQLSQLLQFPDLKVIVVAFGPNDLGWTTQLGLYVAARRAAGSGPDIEAILGDLATSVWNARRSAFLVDLNLGLLPQLASLPSRPRIIVLGSYDLFGDISRPGDCPGTGGLSGADIQIIEQRTSELNSLLAGAVRDADAALSPAEPRFSFVQPRLASLCSPTGRAAPDLHGLDESYPLHPTALGEAHIAAAVQPYVSAALAGQPLPGDDAADPRSSVLPSGSG